MNGIYALIKGAQRSSFAMRGYTEKSAIRSLEEGPQSDHADILLLDFEPPEL